MSDGLKSWKRVVEAEVRERRLALARARQQLTRVEQIAAFLAGERARRDEEEFERRRRGELPDFARERLNALLERAIGRAGEQVSAAKNAEKKAQESVREAWQRATAIERLLDRRAERAEVDARRVEQKELDEIAIRRASAPQETIR